SCHRLLQSEFSKNLAQSREKLLIVLADSDSDANAILAAVVTRPVAYQNAARPHLADEWLAELANMHQHKIRAAWPEANGPRGKFVFKLASAINRLSYVITNVSLVVQSDRQTCQLH